MDSCHFWVYFLCYFSYHYYNLAKGRINMQINIQPYQIAILIFMMGPLIIGLTAMYLAKRQ